MSEQREDTPCPPDESDEIIDRIHGIQEEIFEREDSIDEMVESAASPEPLETLVEEGHTRRRRLRLGRLRADWEALLENSRALERESDFELAAALVHFVGDLLLMQDEGIDEKWIAKLKAYIAEQRAQVN